MVPTMRRGNDGYAPFKSILESNKHLLSNGIVSDIYIYCDKEDVGELSDCFESGRYKHIARVKHEENKAKTGYDFWRSNLCLDFIYSLSEAARLTGVKNVMWLEDDSILEENAIEELMRHSDKDITMMGHGSTAVIVKSEYLAKLRERMITSDVVNNTNLPLDWFLEKIAFIFDKRLNYHQGKVSTRTDKCVVRDIEYRK